MVAELDTSVNYVVTLPQSAMGLRKAGLLMMMPAYETILLAAQQLPQIFTPKHAIKIPHTTMAKCVLRAQKIASDDLAIGQYAEVMSAKVKSIIEAQAFPVDWRVYANR